MVHDKAKQATASFIRFLGRSISLIEDVGNEGLWTYNPRVTVHILAKFSFSNMQAMQ